MNLSIEGTRQCLTFDVYVRMSSPVLQFRISVI